MNTLAQLCQLCAHAEKIPWRGVWLCPLCDNPPMAEAVWFVYWRYADPSDEA